MFILLEYGPAAFITIGLSIEIFLSNSIPLTVSFSTRISKTCELKLNSTPSNLAASYRFLAANCGSPTYPLYGINIEPVISFSNLG